MPQMSQNVTQLLIGWSKGDKEALDALLPLVYEELRQQASRYLRRERVGHTLQTTALIHEAYLKLVDQTSAHWQNRAQFFGVAAQIMRRILVDFARSRASAKKGGGTQYVSLSEAMTISPERGEDLIALDDALESLAELDARKSRIVELRFFGGLSVEETAEVLKISARTVMRDWGLAQAWLYRELSGVQHDDA